MEREIAALDSQIKSIDLQLKAIETQKQDVSADFYSRELSKDVVQDLKWLEAWKTKLVYTIKRLEGLRLDLIAARTPKRLALSQLIVKENLIQKKRDAQLKLEAERLSEIQTSERLETWINTHVV